MFSVINIFLSLFLIVSGNTDNDKASGKTAMSSRTDSLVNILFNLDNEEKIKYRIAKSLSDSGHFEGVEWLMRKYSHKKFMFIGSTEQRLWASLKYSSDDFLHIPYLLCYLGDQNTSLRRRIVSNIQYFPSSELSRFLQNLNDDPDRQIRINAPDMPVIYPVYNDDKRVLSIFPQGKDRIKISKKIFRVYQHPEGKNKIIFVSKDSAFVYNEGKKRKAFALADFPELSYLTLQNKSVLLVYGREHFLWIQRDKDLLPGFPKEFENPILYIRAYNNVICVVTRGNVYLMDCSGNIIFKITPLDLSDYFKYSASQFYARIYLPGYSSEGTVVCALSDKILLYQYFGNLGKVGMKEIPFRGKVGDITDINIDGEPELISIYKDSITAATIGYNAVKRLRKWNYNGEEIKEINYGDMDGDGKKEIIILTFFNKVLIYDLDKKIDKPDEIVLDGNGFHIIPIILGEKDKVFVTGTKQNGKPFLFELENKRTFNLPILPESVVPEYKNGKINSFLLFTPYMGYLYRVEFK